MGEETSEVETKEEEIEEYELIEEVAEEKPKEAKPKDSKKTKIVRDKKEEGLDYCPFCKSENLGKDHKKNIYICLDCGRAYQIV